MERMELLITQVRENTNLQAKNGVSDSNVLRHFNHTQKAIQSLVYQERLEPDLFIATHIVTVTSEVTYDLPSNIFAGNSILYVEAEGRSKPLRKIQSSERGEKTGYFVENNQIGFSENLLGQHPSFTVKYFRRLPDLDIRRGKITAKTPSTITLALGHSTQIGVISDFVTVVDKFGTIIQEGLYVESLAGQIITTSGVSDSVTADHFVVCGAYATTNSELPDECLPLLLDQVEMRLLSRNVSKETGNQMLFTDAQSKALLGLFADNSSDPVYPPMTDTEFNY